MWSRWDKTASQSQVDDANTQRTKLDGLDKLLVTQVKNVYVRGISGGEEIPVSFPIIIGISLGPVIRVVDL